MSLSEDLTAVADQLAGAAESLKQAAQELEGPEHEADPGDMAEDYAEGEMS